MTLPAVDRAPAVTRTNRSGLLVIGVLLLAAGVVGLVLSVGGFGSTAAERPVLDPDVRTYAAEHDWFWLVVGAVALLAAYLGWRWLRTQLSTTRLRRLDLETDRSRGATTLQAGALESAAAEDIAARRGVADADALLLGSRDEPRLVLFVTLDGRESLRAVDATVQSEVVPRIRRAVDIADLPIRVEYRLATSPTRRIA